MDLADYHQHQNVSDYIPMAMGGHEPWNSTYNTSDHVTQSDNLRPSFIINDPQLARLQDYVRLLHDYYLPFIYVGAIVGNVFSMFVITDPALRCLSTTQYLYGILLSEILHCLALLHSWLEEIGVDTGTYQIGGWCQFATFVTSIAAFLATWYTVMLMVDRTFWKCLSGKKNLFCRPLRAKIVLVGVAVIAIIVYFNISILYGTIVAGPRLVCTTLDAYDNIHDNLSKGDVLFNGLFPLLSVLLLLIIIHTFGRCDRKRQPSEEAIELKPTTHIIPAQINGATGGTEYGRQMNMANQIGFFSMFAIIFVLFNAPHDLYRLYEAVGNMIHTEYNQDASFKRFLMLQIFQCIKCTKYTVNILIFITAYPLFRTAAANLPRRVVLCISLCKNSGQSHQSNNIEAAFPEEV